MRKLFAALAFATLGPLGCAVGDAGDPPELEEAYSAAAECTTTCDLYMWYCLTFPQSCPQCDQSNWSLQTCISNHQRCLLACPPAPDCSCQNGS
jgi:hypothetical protein